jgi:hypothetical protein
MMTSDQLIASLTAKIRRDRKRARVFSPLILGFLMFAAWRHVQLLIANWEAMTTRTIPKGATFDLLRCSIITDCTLTIASALMTLMDLALLVWVAILIFAPHRREQLLLCLADKMAEKNEE